MFASIPEWYSCKLFTLTLCFCNERIPFALASSGIQGRFNIWKLRTIMDRASLQEWEFHHVPMFATRARDVSESLSAAATNGVTLYDPL